MSQSGDKQDVDQSYHKANNKELQPDAQKPVARHIDLTKDLSEYSAEERARRKRALLSMLATTQERQQQALRHRLPALVPGLVVTIRSGQYQQRQGTVQDADYIHSKALLHIEGESEAQWVEFSQLAPVIGKDAGG